MTQFTSSPAKCSHVSSSGRTKNCRAGFRQWARQAAIPVLHHVFEWGQCQSQVCLQHDQNHLRKLLLLTRIPQDLLHPESPWELTPNTAGWAQGSQRCIWAPNQANLWGASQRSAEERSSERIQFPAQYWVSQPGKPGSQKKLLRGDNVPKCFVNILKLNIYSKVN